MENTLREALEYLTPIELMPGDEQVSVGKDGGQAIFFFKKNIVTFMELESTDSNAKKIALFGRCVEILPLGVERFENLLGGRDVGNNIHLLASIHGWATWRKALPCRLSGPSLHASVYD